MNQHILLIEDDPAIASFIQAAVQALDFSLTWHDSGRKGLYAFQASAYDCILLDLGLPDMDGKEVLSSIRQVSDVALIVISARVQEDEKVSVLELGADDYMTKPFGAQELVARIKTAIRHHAGPALKSTFFTFNDLVIDGDHHRVSVRGVEIHCTPIEFKILMYLAENKGKVVTLDQIAKAVWPTALDDVQVVRVNVANIRRKIEKNPAMPEYIQTEVGIGYRLVDSSSKG